ncbi:MAG: hypothetical protein WC125_09225 [Bacteroidales bacterium]
MTNLPETIITTNPQKVVRYIPVKPEFIQTTATKILRVAAYCRVSTDKEEQHLSYDAQKEFYTDKIMQTPEWVMAGIYADEYTPYGLNPKSP